MKEAKFDFYCPKFIIKEGTCTIFSCQALTGSEKINAPPPDQLRSDFSGLNNAQKVSKIFFYRKKNYFLCLLYKLSEFFSNNIERWTSILIFLYYFQYCLVSTFGTLPQSASRALTPPPRCFSNKLKTWGWVFLTSSSKSLHVA